MCLFIMISFDILELDNLYIPIMSRNSECSLVLLVAVFFLVLIIHQNNVGRGGVFLTSHDSFHGESLILRHGFSYLLMIFRILYLSCNTYY